MAYSVSAANAFLKTAADRLSADYAMMPPIRAPSRNRFTSSRGRARAFPLPVQTGYSVEQVRTKMAEENSPSEKPPVAPISWADWNRWEIAIRDFHEKRALEAQKASTEFSKLVITNLSLINAGGLLALPATATFIGVPSTPAEKFNFVGIPAILYIAGLFCGLLCGYVTYRNYQYGQSSIWPAYHQEIARLRKDMPWMKSNAEFQAQVTAALDSSTTDLEAKNRWVQITYYGALALGWIAAGCFLCASGWLVFQAALASTR